MHNNTPIVPYISLCSGYEGIGLGLHRCIPNLRCIAYCEREAYAIANLVAKMEKGLLDEAPVFTDVTTFPWEQFAPYMAGGILSFGWPCQPVSMAGKRKATEDERWLFDIIAGGISILKPRMLFAENVEGLLSAKMPDGSLVFSHCIERLERLHYKVETGIFSAFEVGAWHERRRVFILAANTQARRIQGSWANWKQSMEPLDWQALFNALPTLPSPCLEAHRVRFAAECIDLDGSGEELECPECKTDFADCACIGPSMDDDFDYQEDSAGQLKAYSKSEIHGGNDGLADWVERMQLCGNGVVPATATKAFLTLLEKLK